MSEETNDVEYEQIDSATDYERNKQKIQGKAITGHLFSSENLAGLMALLHSKFTAMDHLEN